MDRLNLCSALMTFAGVSLASMAAAETPAPTAETFFQSYEGSWKCDARGW